MTEKFLLEDNSGSYFLEDSSGGYRQDFPIIVKNESVVHRALNRLHSKMLI